VIYRIIGAVIVIGLIYAGYHLGAGLLEQHKLSEYNRYASAIAETSIAAELHRHNQEQFYTARDSILSKYKVTLEEMLNYEAKFTGDHDEKLFFWNIVSEVTDSMVNEAVENLKSNSDSLNPESLQNP